LVFFVAEAGSNWEGDVKKAYQLIKECKDAGADAVKFQMWRAKDLYGGKYKKYELTFPKAIKIWEYCNEIKIEFFCSVFYPGAVEFLEKLGVKRYKIANRTANLKDPYAQETIDAVVRTGKDMIVSAGRPPFNNDYELYCIPEYPANPDDIDWDAILELDGFSDHTLGIGAAIKYGRLCPDGIIEKHVKLKDSKGPDAHFSITTQELATLITRLTISSDIPG